MLATVTICNQAASATTFRLSVAIAGAADTAAQYTHSDVALAPNDTLTLTLGVTLAATDVLRARSANGQVSFNVFGAEIT